MIANGRVQSTEKSLKTRRGTREEGGQRGRGRGRRETREVHTAFLPARVSFTNSGFYGIHEGPKKGIFPLLSKKGKLEKIQN
jgi:hypothetical protein